MFRTFSVLVLACIAAAGCLDSRQPPAPFPPEAETAITTEVPAAEWVTRAVAPSARLQALEMQGKMKVVDAPNEFHLRCNVQALVARPDRIRLAATKGLGTEVLELALAGNSIDVWIPRRELFLRGRLDDLAKTGVRFDPREIVDHLLLPVARYGQEDWQILAQTESALAIETVREDRTRERLTVDPRDGALLRREIFDPRAKVLLDVEYSRHQDLPGRPSDELFPHRMRMRFPQEGRRLILVVTAIQPGVDLRADDFRLMAPDGVDVRALDPDMAVKTEAAVREALEDPERMPVEEDGAAR